MSIDLFSSWVPFECLDIAKGEYRTPNGDQEGEQMLGRIRGWASSEAKDQQGDEIIQKGIDWSYFLTKGWFTYEHDRGPDNVIGHPETIEKGQLGGAEATKVEGVLYLSDPRAKKIWETAFDLQKAKAPRRLGLSIQGHSLMRQGNRVVKSRVLNVGVTAHPVNPDMKLEALARSLTALDKATTAGYQAPAVPGNNSMSTLAKQSLDPVLSSAVEDIRGRSKSVEEVARMLSKAYGLPLHECRKIAKTMVSAV